MSDVRWPPMIWIGGAPGAGKSTIGRALAHKHDLPLHPIDRWTYVHAGLQPAPPLAEALAGGAESAADRFKDLARNRLALVLSDVIGRELAEVPALVEGPQLFPEFAGPLSAGHPVWLVPDPEQTRRAREHRLASVDDPQQRALVELLLRRDAVIASRIRQQARASGLSVIEVGADPDWGEIEEAVDCALAPALTESPRLTAGPELARQRRFENEAAARQIELWTTTEGIGGEPEFGYACECGESGCADVTAMTVAAYRAAQSQPNP